MKIANSVKVTVFVKEEDDEKKIKEKLISLFPFNLEEERLAINEQTATGFDEKKIKILEVNLTKDRHVQAFFENLLSRLSKETKKMILGQIETRIDDGCNFFLRLCKDRLLKEDEFFVTDAGTCFHIKTAVSAFPQKKEIAVNIIRNIFKPE